LHFPFLAIHFQILSLLLWHYLSKYSFSYCPSSWHFSSGVILPCILLLSHPSPPDTEISHSDISYFGLHKCSACRFYNMSCATPGFCFSFTTFLFPWDY
jgi:hypothetical protein